MNSLPAENDSVVPIADWVRRCRVPRYSGIATVIKTILLALIFFMLLTLVVGAQTTNVLSTNSVAASSPATNAAPLLLGKTALPDVGTSLLRVVGALILVIAIFLAFIWLFRNWQRLLVQRGKAPKLNVLEVKSLGGRHSLYVVGYEQDRFLVATSPAGVNLLSHLPQATVDAPKGDAPKAEPAPGMSFSQALSQVLKGK